LTEAPVDGPSQGWVSHLEPMLEEYYRTRGWDKNGQPTPKKLAELGLTEFVELQRN
jgi:aldehyde:ferredoxin oxidoreductase